jgi:hypothetical protein
MGRDRERVEAILGADEVSIMNARFAHVLSRLSIVSVVAVSALGASACARGSSTAGVPSPAAEATQASTSAAQRGPGHWLFQQIEALDLRDDQRASVAEIQQNLAADMAPHREEIRQIAHLLADAVEAGQLDAVEAAAHKASLTASLGDVKASFAGAINGVHDVLDAGQRAALVARLEEQHQYHQAQAPNAQHQGGLAKLAFEIGLSEEQKATLRDAMQKGVDDLFPERAVRREQMETRMKALREAFVTDDFDAADFDLTSGAEEALASFVAITARAVDVSGRVLSDGQRLAAAEMIREHAERL